jgi:hypothetical protein
MNVQVCIHYTVSRGSLNYVRQKPRVPRNPSKVTLI